MSFFPSLYPYFPFQVKKANGIWIEGTNGKRYLDTFSGIGVNLLGHRHPAILRAIRKKMKSTLHLSNFFQDSDLNDCIDQLSRLSGLPGHVLFTNSGAEATEWAIKILNKALPRQKQFILHFEGSFHGRTTGALALNGFSSQRNPFEPLLGNTIQLPWNDTEKLDEWMKKKGQETGAVFLEIIQGAGGVRVLSDEIVKRLLHWQTKLGFYIVADEIQTGLGRTGSVFAYQPTGIMPDIVTLGKGLGGGLPLGALIVNQSLAKTITPGDHGSTMAPNPLSLAGCKIILSLLPDLLERVKKQQTIVWEFLESELRGFVREIRGKGYMIGIDIGSPSPDLAKHAFDKQLLINVIQGQVIRLLPPLSLSLHDWKLIIRSIHQLLRGDT